MGWWHGWRVRGARAASAFLAVALAAGTAAGQTAPDAMAHAPLASISGNPAATTFQTGTGWLGRTLGLKDEWGIRLGGLWLADFSVVAAGGVRPGEGAANSALFLGLNIDADKLVGWTGASFGFQYLQFNGKDTNFDAGADPGYNGIVGLSPWNRSEIYEAWYEQKLFSDMLKIRVGRSTPSADFNNVLRPITFADQTKNIPALSGLLYTPIFVNATMLGVLPGYYNPGDGVTVNFTPNDRFYVNVGAYDGNAANGILSGLNPPRFNGYYFMIGEVGVSWLLGEGQRPGQLGIGLWRQTGQMSTRRGITEEGTGGVYLFGSQQVAYGLNDRVRASSVSVFWQFGANQSETLPFTQYYGAGITGFGLIGNRELDSMGMGVSLARLNQNIFDRPSQLMLQAYYQAHMVAAIFLQPTITYIPTPGASSNTPGALMATMRLTVLF
jgi:porin